MTKPFLDKVALVTGGNAGIGLASAIALANAGAKIIISARREEEGKRALEKIKACGVDAYFIKTDVKNPQALQLLFEKTMEYFGRLDFAINNAGILGPRKTTLMDYCQEDWDEVLETNVTGVWLCMKHEISIMMKQRAGVIINISSIAGLRAGIVSMAYTASKHAVVGLTRQAAQDYGKHGIRVNAICPGPTFTAITTDASIYKGLPVEQSIPIGRYGKVEEIAAAIVWLCQEDSAFVNGIAVPIDGGAMA